MRTKKMPSRLSALCMMVLCAASVFAQDDLDNLLNDLESTPKKPAAAAPAKPAEAKPAEETKPAEAAKPAEEAKPAVAEAKPAEETKPAEAAKPAEEAKPAVAEAQPAEETKPAEAAKPAEEAKPAVAEAKPAEEAKPAAAPKPAVAAEPAHPEAELISDLVATETLRRESMDRQALQELEAARKALAEGDNDGAFRSYQLAQAHLSNRADMRALRMECLTGMAQAKYEAGKRMLKEGNREAALIFAKEALQLRHPRAQALIDALQAETVQAAERDVSEIRHRRNDEDYKASRETVRLRLRLAAQYLSVTELDKATEQAELVLRDDPYNQEAIRIRERIQRRRQLVIEKERVAARKGMIADVDAAWRPVYAVNSVELKDVDGGTSKTPVGAAGDLSGEQDIEKRMKAMILPAVTFKPPATISDAVDFFKQASKDYDRPEIPADQRGFNFVLDPGRVVTGAGEEAAKPAEDNGFAASADDAEAGAAGGLPQIPNISANNISLWDALKLVCKVTSFKFSIQNGIVMVIPKDMTTDNFTTRSYNVVESFLDTMSNASNDLKSQKAGEFGKDKEEESGDGNAEADWKAFFEELGVEWPKGSRIKYIKTIGKLRVTNTEDNLAVLEQALNELNVTPIMIEIETRFVEVAQEDLNSLGFEWLLNSDYSLNVGNKLGKALGLKNGTWGNSYGDVVEKGGISQTSWTGATSDALDLTGTSTRQTDGTTGSTYSQVTGGYVQDSGSQGTQSSATSQSTYTGARNQSAEYARSTGAGRSWVQGSGSQRNLGVSAVNGTDYSTGMRYLSNSDHITQADGTQYNDQFMKINGFLGNADVSMILHMLSQRSDTDLLSAPKVVTKPDEEATIKVVTIYKYPQDYDVTIQSTSSGSSSGSSSSSSSGGSDGKILPMVEPQNFQDQEVGVILTVTPHYSAEIGLITLDLEPKVISEPTWKDYGMKVPMDVVRPSTYYSMLDPTRSDEIEWFTVPMEQPFFKERSIKTKISIYNGATVVMGGLITEDRKSQEDKIPFLGDIPFIGRLFRSRSEWSDKRNLLLFVTARIIDPNGHQKPMSSGSDEKPAEQKPTAAPEAK